MEDAGFEGMVFGDNLCVKYQRCGECGVGRTIIICRLIFCHFLQCVNQTLNYSIGSFDFIGLYGN